MGVSSIEEEGMDLVVYWGSSWISMISELFFSVSRMASVRILFFLTFCEYMHRDLIFIICYRLWLSG